MPHLSQVRKRKIKEQNKRTRARWLAHGLCYVCGKPRAPVERKASWGKPRGRKWFRKLSAKHCAYHLRKNREYQARHRRNAA